jgi:hypothetical protein
MIMAIVALISGLVAAGWALAAAPWNIGGRIVLALLALAGTFFLIVGTLAVAEVLKLFMDVEHNTRITALRMMGQKISVANALMTNDGGTNRIRDLDEETAEGALLRGH